MSADTRLRLLGGGLSNLLAPPVKTTPTTPIITTPTKSATIDKHFGVLQIYRTGPMSDLIDAGCTSVVIQAFWDRLQPIGPGTLDVAEVDALRLLISAARTVGLKVILEVAIHYPPQWVKDGVPHFLNPTNQGFSSPEPGRDIRDWFTQQVGRDIVGQFVDLVIDAAGLLNSEWVRCGGGNYGELSYPIGADPSVPQEFWSFGGVESNGRAVDIPNPPSTDVHDAGFQEWHLNITAIWITWFGVDSVLRR